MVEAKSTQLANEGGEQRARYLRVQWDKGTRAPGKPGRWRRRTRRNSGRLVAHPCAMCHASDVKALTAGSLA